MKAESAFVISPFTNTSGEIVFRVAGSLDGKRIRKNFSNRAEAEAERQTLRIRLAQAESGVVGAAAMAAPSWRREVRRFTGAELELHWC